MLCNFEKHDFRTTNCLLYKGFVGQDYALMFLKELIHVKIAKYKY